MATPIDQPVPSRSVLVTGGAGFIGSHLTDLLLARGDRVTVVDDLSTGDRDNLPPSHERLEFIHAQAGRACREHLAGRGFDQCYHLAAAVGVRLVVEDPAACIETNILETDAVLRFALTAGRDGRPAPVLVASSSEVYGKAEKSPFSEDDDVVYGPTTVFRWAYAMSKAVDEYLALTLHRQRGLPVVVTRFFNTVGPRQVGRYGMVLPRFVAAALAGTPLPIHGDGSQSRCFCDVRDVAGVLPRMLGAKACHGRVFNVGSDRIITIDQLADLVIKVTGSASRKTYTPYSEAYAAGFEDLRQRKPDLRRVREAVGFDPTVPLERTILDVAAWLRVHPAALRVS
ncbi:MAG TPA: NAD-dependent epimerase/dehydratase family protein [Phycisphaerales bacterium]|nr:NAD-dependent epimerase/dehydratase family protein [Phycisphaerales bacterium]